VAGADCFAVSNEAVRPESTLKAGRSAVGVDRQAIGFFSSRFYRSVALVLFLIAFALRGMYALRMAFNSDEPQHAHVIWMARSGLVQYRDFSDNHAPLFHLMWEPIARLLPPTWVSTIVLRLTMLPIYLASLGCTYLIARALLGRRIAMWTAALLALWPSYYELTLEFRPDQLWALFWLAAVAATLQRDLSSRRAGWIGFCLGCATAVSLKTLPLLVCLAIAAVVTRVIFRRRFLVSRPACIGTMIGFLLAPMGVALYFWRQKALSDLYASVIGLNLSTGMAYRQNASLKLLVFLVVVIVVTALVRVAFLRPQPTAMSCRRTFVIVLAVLSAVMFRFVWPDFTLQDSLPITPLIAISLMTCVVAAMKRLPQLGAILLTERTGVVAMVGLLIVLFVRAPYHDDMLPYHVAIDQVNELLKPGEPVVDLKGEFVFYPRAIRPVYETLSRHTLRKDPGADNGPEQIIAAGARLAPRSVPNFPARTRQFLQDNFVPVNAVAVAGKWLKPSGDGHEYRFHIELADSYHVVSHGGPIGGFLDGKPVAWPCFIGVGDHVFVPDAAFEPPLVLIWRRALENNCAIAWEREVRP